MIQLVQIFFPQHDSKVVWRGFNGNGRKQIGQSSRGGCSLNNASSCNSATLLSHAFLCFERCFFLHAALQYLTILHLLHVFRSPPSLPHAAQFVVVSVLVLVDAMVKVFVCVSCLFVYVIRHKLNITWVVLPSVRCLYVVCFAPPHAVIYKSKQILERGVDWLVHVNVLICSMSLFWDLFECTSLNSFVGLRNFYIHK